MARTGVPRDAFKKGATPTGAGIAELSLGPHLYTRRSSLEVGSLETMPPMRLAMPGARRDHRVSQRSSAG
jgi:hypothetical protein